MFVFYCSTFTVCSVAISPLSLVFDFDNLGKTVYTVCFLTMTITTNILGEQTCTEICVFRSKKSEMTVCLTGLPST